MLFRSGTAHRAITAARITVGDKAIGHMHAIRRERGHRSRRTEVDIVGMGDDHKEAIDLGGLQHQSSLRRAVLVRAGVDWEVFDVAQAMEREGVSVVHVHGGQARDRRMLGDEAVPLPRHRVEPEEVAEQHSVRSGVGHDRNAQVGLIEMPHRQYLARSIHAPRRPMTFGTGAHALDEVARWLSPARQAAVAEHRLPANKCDEAERMLVAEYYQRVFGTDLPESVVGKG